MTQCRRPHIDDVERIEQLLRDLEPAANRAIRSYLRWREPRPDLPDSVVEDWIGLRHPVARRLVEHGGRNKGIDFTLYAAHLPWTEQRAAITETPGQFWVMHVSLDVADRRHIYIDDYWSHPTVQALLPMAGHIIQSGPGLLAVTLPAVGDPTAISDAIGGFFEAVFYTATVGSGGGVRHPWRRGTPELDPRVDADGLLAVIGSLNDDDPISIFSAS